MNGWNLRAKLLTYALLVIAPVAVVAYFTAQSYIAATRAQILSSSTATTSIAVASVDDFLNAAERLLLILSSTSAVQNSDHAAAQDLFAQTLALSPEYLSLYVLDANDQVSVSMPTDPNPSDMRYGIDALRTGRATISGRLGEAQQLTAAMAVPIKRGGQVNGALGVEFALERLQGNIADSVMREHAVVLLLDNAGRVLVAPESRYYSTDTQWMSVAIAQRALHGEQGTDEYVNPLDGRAWLGAFAPVRRAGWAVLVSYPSDEVFAPVRNATLTAALSLGTVLVVAVAFAFWMAARITRPLRRVKDSALAFAQGDYEERVPQAQLPRDEVGQLAIAFNHMAEALQQHMRALMDAQHEIEQKAEDLQRLLDRSVRVQEDERRRIAQEIHDGVTQMMVGSIYEMQAAKQSLSNGNGANEVASRKLTEALGLASESVSEMRRVIFDLHPTILDELGLVPALQRLVRLNASETLHCTLHIEGTPSRLPSTHELALYRIAQEALNNVRQHASAHHARVLLRFERDATLLKVSDDGRGIATPTPAFPRLQKTQTNEGVDSTPLPRTSATGEGLGVGVASAQHLGLVGMKERAQSVGGTFVMTSEQETGTSIVVTIPKMTSDT